MNICKKLGYYDYKQTSVITCKKFADSQNNSYFVSFFFFNLIVPHTQMFLNYCMKLEIFFKAKLANQVPQNGWANVDELWGPTIRNGYFCIQLINETFSNKCPMIYFYKDPTIYFCEGPTMCSYKDLTVYFCKDPTEVTQ